MVFSSSLPGFQLTSVNERPSAASVCSLADAIDKYIATSRKKIGNTKAQVLETIKGMDIAEKQCRLIDSAMLIELAEELLKGRQPQTVANYMSHLQVWSL